MEKVAAKIRQSARDERGFTLLEYCAGAAVVVLVLYTAMSQLGGNIQTFMQGIGTWATNRAAEVSTHNGGITASNGSRPTP